MHDIQNNARKITAKKRTSVSINTVYSHKRSKELNIGIAMTISPVSTVATCGTLSCLQSYCYSPSGPAPASRPTSAASTHPKSASPTCHLYPDNSVPELRSASYVGSGTATVNTANSLTRGLYQRCQQLKHTCSTARRQASSQTANLHLHWACRSATKQK